MIVTRGDVDMQPVIDSLPRAWEIIVWDNSLRQNLSVYGRYAAIAEATNEVIYVQDDDCVLPPESLRELLAAYDPEVIVSNTPARFRDRYIEHCLVGFGAVFKSSLVEPAFARFDRRFPEIDQEWMWPRSDVIFTALNERRLVDLPYADQPWAHADNRMWKQPGHGPQRETMLGLALAAKLPANDPPHQ